MLEGKRRGCRGAPATDVLLADALNGLGIAGSLAGDLLGAAETFERGLAASRETGSRSTLTIGLGVLG